MRRLLLLRPEPGLSESVERARALGIEALSCPLFQVEPVEWAAPDPELYDGLLLTSPNAARHAGVELRRISKLPVYAVGAKTAATARDAGLEVAATGSAGVAALLESVPESLNLLHLAGADRRERAGRHRIDRLTVYRSAPIADPGLPELAGLVVAVHSPRAGARLADLAAGRSTTAIAAISTAAAEACGAGWERVESAASPDDARLLALAATLCQTSPPR